MSATSVIGIVLLVRISMSTLALPALRPTTNGNNTQLDAAISVMRAARTLQALL
jgi:hypothetical protein